MVSVKMMKITLLGTSGGIPIPGRAQSGILIEVSDEKILLDCGMGVPLRLSESGVGAEEIDIISLTHGHLDHIQDLPSLTKASWLRTEKADYKIITPPGLRTKLINFWKSLDEFEKSELDFKMIEPEQSFQSNDEGTNIKAFKTEHTRMSQGYEISYDGEKLVHTGDTATCEKVKEKAIGVDLLIHEVSHIAKTEGHTNPEDLISELKGIDVGELVITHFYPSTAEKASEISTKIQEETDIPTNAGEDLKSFTI